MKTYPRKAELEARRRWTPVVPLFLAATLFLACSTDEGTPSQENGGDAAAGEASATASQAGTAGAEATQEAPACVFRASGEELTGRASPPDSASIELGGQTAKLCYGAPSMREREIMGGLVPFDQPWRMGANEPTTLHVPFAAEIGSVRVEPGSYALYAIPGEAEWTIVVNGAPERWGVPIDDEVRAQDIGSFTVEPESLEEPVEKMSIRMEPAEDGGAVVTLEWENTRVSFPLRRIEA